MSPTPHPAPNQVLTQMFELVVSSKNPTVSSLMPPSVAALAALSVPPPPTQPHATQPHATQPHGT